MPSRSPTGPEQTPPQVTAADVLEKVAAAGGHLELTGLTAAELIAWRRAARTAQLQLWRAGSARLSKRTYGDKLWITVRDPTNSPAPARERPAVVVEPESFVGRVVRVPAKLPPVVHPLVVRMREGFERRAAEEFLPYSRRSWIPDWIPDVPRAKVPRTLRIWQAIAVEAEFRKYEIVEPLARGEYHLILRAGYDDEFAVQVSGDHGGLRLTVRTRAATRRGGAASWFDTEHRLERQLGAMFDHIENLISTAREQRAEQARQATERRTRWEAAMNDARERFALQHRRNTLTTRIRDAAEADDIRGYAAALHDAADYIEDTARRTDVIAWADWARTYADRLDPIRTHVGIPTTPTPSAEELKPHLRGWHSVWGPD